MRKLLNLSCQWHIEHQEFCATGVSILNFTRDPGIRKVLPLTIKRRSQDVQAAVRGGQVLFSFQDFRFFWSNEKKNSFGDDNKIQCIRLQYCFNIYGPKFTIGEFSKATSFSPLKPPRKLFSTIEYVWTFEVKINCRKHVTNEYFLRNIIHYITFHYDTLQQAQQITFWPYDSKFILL